MTLYFSWNAWCQNMSSPDELIDIHEMPGVLLGPSLETELSGLRTVLHILQTDPSLSAHS